MNANRIINMIIRQLVREGVNRGIDAASRRGKAVEDMTPEEREQARNTKSTAQKAQRGIRMMRRFMR